LQREKEEKGEREDAEKALYFFGAKQPYLLAAVVTGLFLSFPPNYERTAGGSLFFWTTSRHCGMAALLFWKRTAKGQRPTAFASFSPQPQDQPAAVVACPRLLFGQREGSHEPEQPAATKREGKAKGDGRHFFSFFFVVACPDWRQPPRSSPLLSSSNSSASRRPASSSSAASFRTEPKTSDGWFAAQIKETQND
jgi:hypothetical protein